MSDPFTIFAPESAARPDVPIEALRRELRQPPSVLADKPSSAHFGPELPKQEQEQGVLPFALALRQLIDSERPTAARRLLDVAPAHILAHPIVSSLRAVLAPPAVKRVDRRDVDRSREYRWLRAEAAKYRGRWIAVDGDNLVASANTLRELRQMLKGLVLPRAPLLHRVD